jgi:hypothetical protein
MKPPPADTLRTPDRWYVKALQHAAEVVENKDGRGVTYSWLLLPSRNTWPTKHVDRPAPTPGCGCTPCNRPRCCNTWAEPVELFTGEVVAWVCPTCIEPVEAMERVGKRLQLG